MGGFVLGVLSSVAATVLTVGVSWLASKRLRQLAIRALSWLTGVGIERSYEQQRLANADLGADLERARWVRVLTGRGNELTRDSFQSVWRESGRALEYVQVLLPDPGKRGTSFLSIREVEARGIDAGYRPGLLAQQIRSNVEYIKAATADRSNVELRLSDFPNIYRIIITDQVAYLTLYPSTEHGRNGPCLVFSHPGILYDLALRIFAVTWTRAAGVRQ